MWSCRPCPSRRLNRARLRCQIQSVLVMHWFATCSIHPTESLRAGARLNAIGPPEWVCAPAERVPAPPGASQISGTPPLEVPTGRDSSPPSRFSPLRNIPFPAGHPLGQCVPTGAEVHFAPHQIDSEVSRVPSPSLLPPACRCAIATRDPAGKSKNFRETFAAPARRSAPRPPDAESNYFFCHRNN